MTEQKVFRDHVPHPIIKKPSNEDVVNAAIRRQQAKTCPRCKSPNIIENYGWLGHERARDTRAHLDAPAFRCMNCNAEFENAGVVVKHDATTSTEIHSVVSPKDNDFPEE
jgi:transposase-like protein